MNLDENSNRLNEVGIVAICNFLIFAFSPFISFFIGLAWLFFMKKRVTLIDVKLISIISVLSASVIVASREPFVSASDDMARYFDMYHDATTFDFILNPNSNGGGVFEFGLRSVYFILNTITETISIKIFLLLHCFIITSMFLILIFRVIDNLRDKIELDSKFISISLLLFSYAMTTQLSRYFVAVLLLSYILTTKNKLLKFIFFCFATLFHMTSPFLYLFYRFAMKPTGISTVFLVLVVAFTSLNFNLIANVLIGSVIPGFEKLSYSLGGSGFDLPSIASIISVAVSFTSVQLIVGARIDKQIYPLRRVMILSLLVGVLLLPVEILPMRILFPITSVFNGMIMAFILTRFSHFASNFLFMLLFSYKAYSLSGLTQDPGFILWHQYTAIDRVPFYYFLL
jgi:hypothetical protein